MNISWHGKTCIEIQGERGTLFLNPPTSTEKTKTIKGTADVAALSEVEIIEKGSNLIKPETIVIKTPGEYDTRGFFILSCAPGNTANKRMPVLFIIESERKTICYVTDYPAGELAQEDLEKIGNVDVLIISAGENAAKIANQIEPHIGIPINYEDADVKLFLKEMGASDTTPQSKFALKAKDSFSDEERNVVLLSC
jgi:L-ascorbate metabolism protein UlaG (beta-lactamase superfamily)